MAKISINMGKGTVDNTPKRDVIVGIDLGTTNSLVSYMQEDKPIAIKDKQGKNTLVPSIIYFDENHTIKIGEVAKQKLIEDPQNTIFSVKRLMGKSYNDIKDYEGFFSYKVIDDQTDESLVKVRIGDKFYTPIELSAQILGELKLRAEDVLKQPIEKAVITVPAYFNDAQRQATRDAGKLAGLDVLRIVNEPTAASLAYGIGLDADANKTVAVYDLGGGTFDISILKIEHGIFEVLSTNGDTFLGGDDFDRAIMQFWTEKYKLGLKEDRSAIQALRLEAEKAKKALSSQDNFETTFQGQKLSLSKTQFNELGQSLVDRTIEACQKAMKDAELQVSDIDEVIMVGGSTKVPLVQASVANYFEQKLNNTINPDEVVALGAAVQADVLAGNQKGILLLDVTPLSLGIETMGGLIDVIIPRNSKIPIKAGRQYTTSVDGQKNLKVAVYQGERDLVADNRKLGEFVLRNIPPMPAGIPKIEIHFLLNADGILKVRAKELRSGVEQMVEVRSPYGISDEDMARMLVDSIKNAKEDMKVRGLIEARTEASNVIMATAKFLEQNKDILNATEIAGVQELNEQLVAAVKGEDKDLINKYMDDLNTFAQPLAQKAMDRTISEAMKGKKLLKD